MQRCLRRSLRSLIRIPTTLDEQDESSYRPVTDNNKETIMSIIAMDDRIDEILDMSRQKNIGELSPWFQNSLKALVADGQFLAEGSIRVLADDLITDLSDYQEKTKRQMVAIGMSGGVDSALTAALFRDAGWRVVGVTMPIHQEAVETERGIAACVALGIDHIHIDLSSLYDMTVNDLSLATDPLILSDDKAGRIRRGNVRARLRMITLYNLAQANHGLVASTDNLTELAAGFWTLHGDVGDLSPIQSLTKSWEVPMMAKMMGVPESVWRATPTDGLGIDNGDEAQLGASYLEWDIMFLMLDFIHRYQLGFDDARATEVYKAVTDRIALTWFKRKNPMNLDHAFFSRYDYLERIDSMFRPTIFD